MSIAAAISPATPSALTDGKSGAQSSQWDLSFHNLLDIVNPLEHLPIIGTIYRAVTGTHIGMPEKIAGDALYGGLWGAVSGVADAAFELVTGKDFGDTMLSLFTGHHDTQVAGSAPAAAPDQPAAAVSVPDRDFGDRVLSLFTGHHDTQLAGSVSPPNQPAAVELPTDKDFGDRVLAFFTGHHDTQVAGSPAAPPAQPAAAPVATAGPDTVALQASLSRNGVDGDLAQRAMTAYRKSIAMPALVPQPGS